MVRARWIKLMGAVILFCLGIFINGDPTEAKAKRYTISTRTVPVGTDYKKITTYNKNTKQYYTIQSYLTRLGKTGGTLKLKKGTYKIPCTLYIPSNVSIQCDSGVKLIKTSKTGTKKLRSTKYMFQMVSEAKAKKKAEVSGYKASGNTSITGNGRVVVDMGGIRGATAIYAGHSRSVTVSNLQFINKSGSSYIRVEGSRDVTISNCTFYGGAEKGTLKSQLAVRLENINAKTNDFSGKWSKLDNTVNKNIVIRDNAFYAMNACIGTTKHVASRYQYGISVRGNVFKDTKSYAVYAIDWREPSITGNTMSKSSPAVVTKNFVRGLGIYNPVITGNMIVSCEFAMHFDTAKNSGAGKGMRARASKISEKTALAMENNRISGLKHYYVKVKDKRIFYFRNKNDKKFTITTKTEPYHEKYTDRSDYSAYKMYYMFLSYMEQLEYAGGGSVTIEAGTYPITNNICIPSNVTVYLKNGAVLQKKGTRKKTVTYAKSILAIVPPSKDRTRATVGGYNGSSNVKILGSGNAVIDCANVYCCQGIIMGHTKNVTIRGIKFMNQYGLHFIELNSSQNAIVEKCSFINFRPMTQKSHKECINVDGADEVTGGFAYNWSTHDKTTCKNVYIRNNYFKNVGTAVGSHTFSAKGKQLLYHDNVQVINNEVDGTYNAAIRVLNWRNCVIKNNTLKNIASLKDGKLNDKGEQTRYVGLLLRGVLNPVVTDNVFDTLYYYPIRIVMSCKPTTENAMKAGYPTSPCRISDKNWIAMQENTVVNLTEDGEKELQVIYIRENDEEDSPDYRLSIGEKDVPEE